MSPLTIESHLELGTREISVTVEFDHSYGEEQTYSTPGSTGYPGSPGYVKITSAMASGVEVEELTAEDISRFEDEAQEHMNNRAMDDLGCEE